MLRTKVESVSDWVDITLDEVMSPEAKQKAIADFARQQLAQTLEANKQVLGRDTPYEQFVNGQKGAALESATPDRGTIVFEFELFFEVLSWVFNALVDRSPKRSGAYIAGHRLFADGVEVPLSGDIPPAEEYSFTNAVPYARRLEIGKTQSGRDFLISVPNRIYERTAADARARFGNIAKIGFAFRAIIGGAQVNQAKAASYGQPWWLGGAAARAASGVLESGIAKRHGRTAHNRSGVRFPTIVIRPN